MPNVKKMVYKMVDWDVLHPGGELPFFSPGSGHPSPFSAGDMNRIVRVCNAFLKLTVKEGSPTNFKVSGHNAVLTLDLGKGSTLTAGNGINITDAGVVKLAGANLLNRPIELREVEICVLVSGVPTVRKILLPCSEPYT